MKCARTSFVLIYLFRCIIINGANKHAFYRIAHMYERADNVRSLIDSLLELQHSRLCGDIV